MSLEDSLKKLKTISEAAKEAFESAQSLQELFEAKIRFLGKNSPWTEVAQSMGKLSASEKPQLGQELNQTRKFLDELYGNRKRFLEDKLLMETLEKESLDLNLPGPQAISGGEHPLISVSRRLIQILERAGFAVRIGPLMENDFYNFEALNIPPDHPAREMQDTFFLPQGWLLRTHTSPIQIRSLQVEKLPLRIAGWGAVFRYDLDASHLPHFHQLEGLWVDREVSMAHLKGIIRYLMSEFFAKDLQVRFRPSYFPFTEPSAEVDCQCPVCGGKGCSLCRGSGWIEVAGCGLVHPRVLERAQVDPDEWEGFAFGFGIERLAMIRYRIDDIRLFPENDLRFLRRLGRNGI